LADLLGTTLVLVAVSILIVASGVASIYLRGPLRPVERVSRASVGGRGDPFVRALGAEISGPQDFLDEEGEPVAAVDERAIEEAAVAAAVVPATDTIEETALFYDLLHVGPKPIVVTGAMRSASQPGYDGPRNLTDAVRVAASAEAAGADLGVVVAVDGSIDAADDVTKTHASAFDPFRS